MSLFLSRIGVNYKRTEFLRSPFVAYDRLNSNWIKRNRKYSLDTLQTELVVFFFKRLILRRSETHFRPISFLYPILEGFETGSVFLLADLAAQTNIDANVPINKKMEIFISDLISVIKNEFVGNERTGKEKTAEFR